MKKALILLLVVSMFANLGCSIINGNKDTSTASNTPVVTQEASSKPEAIVTEEPVQILTAAPTEVPTEAPTPEPTEEPSPSPLYTSEYKCRVNDLNLRAEPDLESAVVGRIHFEDRIQVIGPENDQFVKALYEGRVCYCYSNYLVPADQELYGYMPKKFEYQRDSKGNIVYESDGVTPVTLKSELIDIRLVIPDVEIYQIFGTDKNFTGQVLYERPVPVLQTATAKKLAAAARRFAQDGYRIKIYDCYRPKSVQYFLYDIVQNSAYIANPYNSASNHNRAAAVDMTLIGPDGKELEFPTPMHTFTKIVYRSSRDQWTEEQRRNVDYMTNVMLESGFKLINTEWWHFSDTDYLSFIVLDVNMKDIPRYTASQLGYPEPYNNN